MTTAPIIAAKWWADLLIEKPNHDNGEPVGSYLANLVAESLQPVTEDQYCNFREALQREIEKQLDGRERFCFGTDYHPDGFLQIAIREAGIDRMSDRFPIKTIMWVRNESVKVSRGYRAPWETVWGRKEPTNENDL